MTVLVSPTLVLSACHCVVLTGCVDTKHISRRFAHKCKMEKTVGKRLGFVFPESWFGGFIACCNFPPIWVEKQFLPVTARLISGDDELLLGMEFTG